MLRILPPRRKPGSSHPRSSGTPRGLRAASTTPVPVCERHAAPRVSRRRVPRAALRREGRGTVALVCGGSEGTRARALAPTLPALPARGAHDPPHRAPLHTAPEPSQASGGLRAKHSFLSIGRNARQSRERVGGPAHNCAPLATARPQHQPALKGRVAVGLHWLRLGSGLGSW